MAIFVVRGPFKIPCVSGKGGRTFTNDNIQDFWRKHSKYQTRRGCYVFAIRAGKGFTPGYVGKAGKTLKQEIFCKDKLYRYQHVLADYASGSPVFFFILAPSTKGKPNARQIGKIEKYLIGLAATANPHLANLKGTKQLDWSIRGVIRGGQGNTSEEVVKFRRMLGIS